MKPAFPEFKILSIDDRSTLVEFARLFPDYTEFNFTYMFAWNLLEPLSFCFLHGNLVLKFTDIQTGKRLLTILGNNKIENSVDEIIRYSADNDMGDTLQNIPEAIARPLLGNRKYTVVEDDRYHDYLLSVHDLAEMRASKFRGKRNLVNRFTKNHGHISLTKEIDLHKNSTKLQIKRVMDEWRMTFEGSDQDIHYEFMAIDRALSHAKQLNLRGFGTFVSGQLESFTIFEIVASKTMVLHFDKSTRVYAGISEHHKNQLANHLASENIELISYQDDLGITELRDAKMHYHPVGYLKKYTVTHSPSHKANRNIEHVTL